MSVHAVSLRVHGRRILGTLRFLFLWKVIGGVLTWLGFWTLFIATEWLPVFLSNPQADTVWLLTAVADLFGEGLWWWLPVLAVHPTIPGRGAFPGGQAYGLVAYAVAALVVYGLHQRYGVITP